MSCKILCCVTHFAPYYILLCPIIGPTQSYQLIERRQMIRRSVSYPVLLVIRFQGSNIIPCRKKEDLRGFTHFHR
jgi:hypothetical protein